MMRMQTGMDSTDETDEMVHDHQLDDESVGLSVAELDAEPMLALPERAQMRMHRHFLNTKHLSFANHRFDHDHDFDDRFRFSRSGFSPFSFNHANRFGNAINVNRTFQSNFNPQISFGSLGGSIVSHNVNMNTNFQVAL